MKRTLIPFSLLLLLALAVFNCGGSAVEQSEFRLPPRQDMRVYDFKTEVITTGTLKEILTADWGYLFDQEQQMELYNVHVDFIEEQHNEQTGQTFRRVKATLDATTGTYYMQPRAFNDVMRNKGDIDLYSSRDEPVIYNKDSGNPADRNFRMEAERLYYNTLINVISTSSSYVIHDHKFQQALSSTKGFQYSLADDTDDIGMDLIRYGQALEMDYRRHPTRKSLTLAPPQ